MLSLIYAFFIYSHLNRKCLGRETRGKCIPHNKLFSNVASVQIRHSFCPSFLRLQGCW